MKNGMKAGKLAVLLGAFGLMCTLTGCTKAGEKAEGQEDEVIRIEASADENAAQNESGQQSDDGRQEQKDAQKEDIRTEFPSRISDNVPDRSSTSESPLTPPFLTVRTIYSVSSEKYTVINSSSAPSSA